VSDRDNMGWATIDHGAPNDSTWLDRSFDGGSTWEPIIASASIPAGFGGWRTMMRAFLTNRGIGMLRACGKAGDRPEIACTPWFGLDPGRAKSDASPVTATQWNRLITLHVSDTDDMGWASIERGVAGDEVWLDRSFDGGSTWEPIIADTTIPPGWTGWRTLLRFFDTERGIGLLRACGKAGDRPEIACTAWFGLDPARAKSDDAHLTATQWNRLLTLHVSAVDGMAWASIDDGKLGDEVWIDRSFDGGATWEPQIADVTIPSGFTGWRTLMRFLDTSRGVGRLRACGKAGDRPEIACTAWSAPQ
jgi:hypothetical protein